MYTWIRFEIKDPVDKYGFIVKYNLKYKITFFSFCDVFKDTVLGILALL